MPGLRLPCGSPAGSSDIHFNRDERTHRRMQPLSTNAKGGIVHGWTSFIRNPLPKHDAEQDVRDRRTLCERLARWQAIALPAKDDRRAMRVAVASRWVPHLRTRG